MICTFYYQHFLSPSLAVLQAKQTSANAQNCLESYWVFKRLKALRTDTLASYGIFYYLGCEGHVSESCPKWRMFNLMVWRWCVLVFWFACPSVGLTCTRAISLVASTAKRKSIVANVYQQSRFSFPTAVHCSVLGYHYKGVPPNKTSRRLPLVWPLVEHN